MSSNNTDFGTLYIVATPIGNLKDITLRAIEILKYCDLILAEDTRHCKILLNHYQIETKTHSLHKFNEQEKSLYCIELLLNGKNLALVSDAGTPLISDPGYDLVKICHDKNIKVVAIPGPCALIAGITISGIPCNEFSFNGFLPPKSQQRINLFKKLLNKGEAQIFYESPKRLLNCLKDIKEVFGENKVISIAKEITKQFEQSILDTVTNIITYFQNHEEKLKGEFVLIISGNIEKNTEDKIPEITLQDILTTLISNDIQIKQAVKIATSLTNFNKNYIYQKALELKL